MVLMCCNMFAALCGFQALQVFRKIAYQITSWNPDWQGDNLPSLRLGNEQRNFEQVRVCVAGIDAVVNSRSIFIRTHVAAAPIKQLNAATRVRCKRIGNHSCRPASR